MVFENREEAGNLLAQKIKLNSFLNTVILGIPRGGVMVAKIIAQKLNLPLDIIVVKKISAPKNPELAIGAVGPPASQARALRAGPKNSIYFDKDLCRRLGIDKVQSAKLKEQSLLEQKEKEKVLRGNKSPINVKGKSVILVDDGVATGATAICASKFLKKEKAREIILATPVIAEDTFKHLKSYFAKIVALTIEKDFYAVGQFYKYFPQVEDEEVIKILDVRA